MVVITDKDVDKHDDDAADDDDDDDDDSEILTMGSSAGTDHESYRCR